MDIQYQKIKSLTLRQISYALAAADEGNVTAAARKLHVSQPAISAAIAALEKHYGLKLFTRLPAQGVTLTAFGIKVMSEARLLCDRARSIVELASPEAEITGDVGICCYQAIAPFVMPRLLHRLAERFPAVSVRFSEANLEDTAASLRNGRADLAITYDLGVEEAVYQQVLYSMQPHVICSKDHEFSCCKTLKLSRLHSQKMILLDQPLSAQYVLGLLKAMGVEPEIVQRVKGFELQRALVANGFGVALVHTLPKANLSYDGLSIHAIPVTDKTTEQRVMVSCLEQNRQRPALDSILQELGDIFAGGKMHWI